MRLAASVSCHRSSDSSHSGTSSSGQTPATAAQTSSPPSCLAGLGEEPVGLVLASQVGLEQHRALAVGRDRLGPLAALVVVDADAAALGCERARAGSADPAGRPGHEHALACQPRLHRGEMFSPRARKLDRQLSSGRLEASQRGTAPRLGPRESGETPWVEP